MRSDDVHIRIERACWIGMAAFRGASMKQKIVKVPKNNVFVSFGCSKTPVVGSIDFDKDLAIREQGEKLDPGKSVVPAESFDWLRCGQDG